MRRKRPLVARGAPKAAPLAQLWLSSCEEGAALLKVWVALKGSQARVLDAQGAWLRVALVSPLTKGSERSPKVNTWLVDFLAQALGVDKAQLAVIAGSRGVRKTVRVLGVAAARIAWLLRS